MIVALGTTNLWPNTILLAALLGASVLGLAGAVMAIPVAATIKTLASLAMRTRDEAPDGTTLDSDGAQ